MNYYKLSIIATLFLLIPACESPSTNDSGNQECLHFEDQVAGTRFDLRSTFTTGGIEIRAEQRTWGSTGRLAIDRRGYARGYGYDLNLSSANAKFMLPYPVTSIQLLFGELGGNNKIIVNKTLQEPSDLIELNGTAIAGVDVFVYAVNEGNNWFGVLVLQGEIQDFELGGQEVWIDNVCFSGHQAPIARSRILFEARTNTNPDLTYTGFWTEYKSDITARGYTFGHVTTGPITQDMLERWDVFVLRPHRYHYSDDEKAAIQQFAYGGKSVWIVAEHGMPFTFPATQDAMSIFDIVHDNNKVTDPTNHELEEFWVIYEQGRNFSVHPILDGVNTIRLDAGATLSGPGFATLVETDDDAVPAQRPVVVAKDYGSGRLLAIADSCFIRSDPYALYDNRQFAMQTTEWLLFH